MTLGGDKYLHSLTLATTNEFCPCQDPVHLEGKMAASLARRVSGMYL